MTSDQDCRVCDSLSAPSVFLKEFSQIPPQHLCILLSTVSQAICLWSSQLACCLFCRASFRDQGKDKCVWGTGMNSPTGVKKASWSGGARAEPHCLGLQNTPVLRDTGKAEGMGFLSLLDSLHLPKKPYSNRHTRQKQSGPREFSPLWSLHWRKSKCTVEILCVR